MMESVPDASGNTLILNSFPEEPLNLSREDGFGFFPACLGTQLHNSRYQIVRKLGRGQFSSTWLAHDLRSRKTPKYHAIKILTAYATKCHHDDQLLELKVMQTINTISKRFNLPSLEGYFEMDGPHGRHLCLVLTLFSETVSDFRLSAPSKSLEPRKAKIIVAEVVAALNQLHGANIIHNDLQANNVLFANGIGWKSIEELLDKSPQIIDGEFVLKGERYQIMRSQLISSTLQWDDPGITVELYALYLTDFGSAHWINEEPSNRVIGQNVLRTPEFILGADHGVKVDIWGLGCMTFELLTGHGLFDPRPGEIWSDDDYLARMLEVTGENFSEKILAKSRNRDMYFDETGKLLRVNELAPVDLKLAMMESGVPETQGAPAADFIRACLHLDPDERPSAFQLYAAPWLYGAYMACLY